MRVPDINPIAEAFATAAGLCFVAIEITFQLMRKRANEQLPRERRISWFMARRHMRKAIIADYKRLYPRGWERRAFRTFQVLWVVFVILAILSLFLGGAT
ncbi:MAG: hypothetical protein ACLQMT_04485 [Candidatus Acidiferrales bacterium]